MREKRCTITVCVRSGQIPTECGLAACDNGCETCDLEFVPAAVLRKLVTRIAGLDDWVAWIIENYPAAIDAMPTETMHLLGPLADAVKGANLVLADEQKDE